MRLMPSSRTTHGAYTQRASMDSQNTWAPMASADAVNTQLERIADGTATCACKGTCSIDVRGRVAANPNLNTSTWHGLSIP